MGAASCRLPGTAGRGRPRRIRYVRIFRLPAQGRFVYPAGVEHLRPRRSGTPACGTRRLVLSPPCLARGGSHDLPARRTCRNGRTYPGGQVESPCLCGPDENFRCLLVLPGAHAGSRPGERGNTGSSRRPVHHRRRRHSGYGDRQARPLARLARGPELRHDGVRLPAGYRLSE